MRNHPASASHFHFGNVFANIAVVPATSPDGWDEMGSVTGRVFVAVDFNAEAQSRREIESQSVEYSALVADKAATSWQNYTFSIFHPPFACAPTNRHPYTVSYAYDALGRLAVVDLNAEAQSRGVGFEYSYLSNADLISGKTATLGNHSPFTILHSTFEWDGWNIIRETATDGNGSTTVTDNVWGLDIDGTLQGAGGVGGLLAVVRDGETYFPTYDANGNISEYVSEGGEVVAHYDYSPFGETLIASGDLASTFTHRFSTKPWCSVTGLCEYQMRKYRPEIGRWLSRDPYQEIFSDADSANNVPMFSYLIEVFNENYKIELIEFYNSLFVNNNSLDSYDILGLRGEKSRWGRYVSRLSKPNKKRLNAYGDFLGLIIDVAYQSLYDDIAAVREKGIIECNRISPQSAIHSTSKYILQSFPCQCCEITAVKMRRRDTGDEGYLFRSAYVVKERCEERIRHGYISSKDSGSFMMYIPWR